MEVMEVIKVM
jgi:hypothetical protein